jgi:hypothetical protein
MPAMRMISRKAAWTVIKVEQVIHLFQLERGTQSVFPKL